MVYTYDYITNYMGKDQATKSYGSSTYYCKDGKFVMLYPASYRLDDNQMPVGTTCKRFYLEDGMYEYYYDESNVLKRNKMSDYVENTPPKIETYASLREGISYGLVLVNPLKDAITADIKTVNFDGISCYLIKLKDKDGKDRTLIFEKETGLLRKKDDTEYYYTFNTVNDKMLEVPEAEDAQKVTYYFNIPKEELN